MRQDPLHDKDIHFLSNQMTRNHTEVVERISNLTEQVKEQNGRVRKNEKFRYIVTPTLGIVPFLMGIIGWLAGVVFGR